MSIKTQALHYVKAVDHSIVAAQHGYTIAEEALGFAELIEAGNIANEAMRQDYLRGMFETARRGEENANIALENFRDVRKTVSKVKLHWPMLYEQILTVAHQLVQDAAAEQTQGREKMFFPQSEFRACFTIPILIEE